MASTPELRRGEVVETSGAGAWLRERRVRIALWIAAIEGLLVVIGAIGKWPAIIVAGAFLVAYFLSYRSIRSEAGRQLSWIVAASQALVVLVPIIFAFVKTIAYLVVAALAVLALLVLFRGERSPRARG
jgi:hypothetical protein